MPWGRRGGTLAGPAGGVPWWGVPWRGVPWQGVPWRGYPAGGYPGRVPPWPGPARGVPCGGCTLVGGTLAGGYPAGGYPDRVPPTQVQPGGYPGGGVPCYPGRYPPTGYPPGQVRGGYPGGGTQIGQQMKYSLHGGRYASCVHAGGLSCVHGDWFDSTCFKSFCLSFRKLHDCCKITFLQHNLRSFPVLEENLRRVPLPFQCFLTSNIPLMPINLKVCIQSRVAQTISQYIICVFSLFMELNVNPQTYVKADNIQPAITEVRLLTFLCWLNLSLSCVVQESVFSSASVKLNSALKGL